MDFWIVGRHPERIAIIQPWVAESPRLPWVMHHPFRVNPERVESNLDRECDVGIDATLSGLARKLGHVTQGSLGDSATLG